MEDKPEIINRDNVEPFITKDTSEIREILAPGNSSLKNQSLAEATLMPGRSTIEHYHISTEEIYYILSGSGKIRIGGVNGLERDVDGHDGIVIMPGMRHKIWNTGDENLVFLCCCSPAYKHEDTVITEEEEKDCGCG